MVKSFQEKEEEHINVVCDLPADLTHLKTNAEQQGLSRQKMEEIFTVPTEMEQVQKDVGEREELLDTICELEHAIKRSHTQNQNLSMELQEVIDKEESLSKQRDTILKEQDKLKTFLRRKHSENKNLLEEVQDLQEKNDHLSMKSVTLSAKVSDLEYLNRRKDGLLLTLREKLLLLKHQVKDTQSDRGNMKKKLSNIEPPDDNSEIKEKDNFLTGNNPPAIEPGPTESHRGGAKEEIENLKKAIQEEQFKVLEAELLILSKDELIAKQLKQIAHKQELLDELYIHNNHLKESLRELKSQLLKKQEDAVLGPNLKDECQSL